MGSRRSLYIVLVLLSLDAVSSAILRATANSTPIAGYTAILGHLLIGLYSRSPTVTILAALLVLAGSSERASHMINAVVNLGGEFAFHDLGLAQIALFSTLLLFVVGIVRALSKLRRNVRLDILVSNVKTILGSGIDGLASLNLCENYYVAVTFFSLSAILYAYWHEAGGDVVMYVWSYVPGTGTLFLGFSKILAASALLLSSVLYVLLANLLFDGVTSARKLLEAAAMAAALSTKYPELGMFLASFVDLEIEFTISRRLRKVSLTKHSHLTLGVVRAVLSRECPFSYEALNVKGYSSWCWYKPLQELPYSLRPLVVTNPHLVIMGSPGAGKSFLTALVVSSLLRSEAFAEVRREGFVLVLDPHGEYGYLLKQMGIDFLRVVPQQFTVNPLALDERGPRHKATELAEIVRQLFNLGNLQVKVLQDAIVLAYEQKGIIETDPSTWSREAPTLNDVVAVLSSMERRNPRASLVKMYVQNLLSSVFVGKPELTFDDFLGRVVIVDMSSIAMREMQALYVESLLSMLFSWIKAQGLASSVRIVLVVDEAHIFARRGTRRKPMVATLAAEGRKYGVSLILATQSVDELHETVTANVGSKFALRHDDPKALASAARQIAVYGDRDRLRLVEETIAKLPKGLVLVKDVRVEEPLLVEIVGAETGG
ncbi:MAG: ATP-binding protein [Thermoproteota archaeon]